MNAIKIIIKKVLFLLNREQHVGPSVSSAITSDPQPSCLKSNLIPHFKRRRYSRPLNVAAKAVSTDSTNTLFKWSTLKAKTNERILCIIQFVRHREHSLFPLESRVAKCSVLQEYNNC
jgi:hypothetical protein